MSTLMTGFPGFLGSRLLPRLAARTSGALICVVQERFRPQAAERLVELEREHPAMRGRVVLATGDITLPALGLSPAQVEGVTEVWHLAAVYDLSVRRDLAVRVNVEGTRRVLDLCRSLPGLTRLHYVSTCYVSGRFPGTFFESDLDKGQAFNNYYEETKYLAEVEVRAAMAEGLPVTVYRPAVVTGDSTTGETQKYDGPYYVIRWIVKQPKVAVMPTVGDIDRNSLNVVPRDWLIDAIDALAVSPSSAGKTYQLADPDPPSIRRMLEVMAAAAGKRLVRVPLPRSVARFSIERIPGVYHLMRIPATAVDYFVHPTRYDTTEAAADLAPSGLALPRFTDYAANLVRFVETHPEISSEAMV